MKYQIEYCPNQDMVILHLSKRLTGKESVSLGDRLFETSLEKAPDFAKKILDTDGIISVSVKDFELRLEKGRVFDWGDITPIVISILANIDSSDDMVEVEKKKTPAESFFEVLMGKPKDMERAYQADQEEQEDENQ